MDPQKMFILWPVSFLIIIYYDYYFVGIFVMFHSCAEIVMWYCMFYKTGMFYKTLILKEGWY